MENILFKDIVKITLLFVCTLTILSLLFWNEHLGVALALFAGALLGILKLKAFFGYIACTLKKEKTSQNAITLIRYLASLAFTLGLLGVVLVKSTMIGLAMLIGLIAVPITVTIYAMFKGISSLYCKK